MSSRIRSTPCAVEQAPRRFGVLGLAHPVAFGLEIAGELLPRDGVVLDDQDVRRAISH
jgi:hypothetical protein